MRSNIHRPNRRLSILRQKKSLISTLLLLFAAKPMLAEHRRELSVTAEATAGSAVLVENLAGNIRIERGGSQVSVDAEVVGETADLAAMVELKVSRRGGQTVIHVEYPVDRYDTYYYPDGPRSSGWGGWGNSGSRYQGERVKITGKKSREAVALHTNLILRLPNGVGAKVQVLIGNLSATDIRGPLVLDTSSGLVEASGGEGELEADTGSGNVRISNHRGNVSADTGSGGVELTSIVGDIVVDTGSGGVRLSDIQAERVEADTGSGEVELDNVRGELSLDTGSGEIRGRNVVGLGRLVADTGSGSVDLSGDFSALERLVIDTGSGEVTLRSSPFPEVDLTVNTGSGDIRVDVSGARIRKKDDDYLEATVGSGRVRAEIDTGSGDVTLREGS